MKFQPRVEANTAGLIQFNIKISKLKNYVYTLKPIIYVQKISVFFIYLYIIYKHDVIVAIPTYYDESR